MRVDEQARVTVLGARRRHDHGIRSSRRVVRHLTDEAREFTVETVEERHFEDETRSDVLAPDGQQTLWHFAWVQCTVVVEAICIGLEHGAHLGRQIAGIASLDCWPYAEQMHEVIAGCGRCPVLSGTRAAGCHHHLGNGRKVVLGVRECETEGHIDVAPTADMGHTPLVAANPRIVGLRHGHQLVDVGLSNAVGPIQQPQAACRGGGERRYGDHDPDDGEEEFAHHRPSPLLSAKSRKYIGKWRLGSESNRRRRLCRPLHDHSAT